MRITPFVRMQLIIFSIVTTLAIISVAVFYIRVPSMVGVGEYNVEVELPSTGGLYQNGNVSKVQVTNTPGWTTTGWNNSFSYLLCLAYERNGRQPAVGSPTGPVQQRSFNNQSRKYYIQEFAGGWNGAGAIIYDPDNAVMNAQATNEAYYVYGSFWAFWRGANGVTDDDPLNYGLPTRDWYQSQDPATWTGPTYPLQNFMWSNGKQHYMLIRSGTVMSGVVEYHSPSPPQLVTGPGQMVYRDHLTHSFNIGNIVWFTTHYPVAGGDYSNTAPTAKVYRNGSPIVGYKEGQYLYITEGYDPESVYEADYPRTEAPVSYGYTFNGWATLTTPSEVLGGTWGSSHAGVFLYRNGQRLTCYKEVGTNLLVTPAPYVSGAVYVAAYPTPATTSFLRQVSYGPGQLVYQERLIFREQIGNIVWFSTACDVAGGDYSATDPALRVYRNGAPIVGYKEGGRVYITEGNDPTALYTIDYHRAPERLQYAYTFNGVPTFTTQAPIWGGVWIKTHAGLRVYKDGVPITAYKEVGTNLIVTPGTAYDPSAVYEADYVEVVAISSSSPSSAMLAGDEVEPSTTPRQLQFALGQNPARGQARLNLTLPQASDVSIVVYDVSGRRVATVADGRYPAGDHVMTWDGRAGAGIYFVRLSTPNVARTLKLVMLR